MILERTIERDIPILRIPRDYSIEASLQFHRDQWQSMNGQERAGHIAAAIYGLKVMLRSKLPDEPIPTSPQQEPAPEKHYAIANLPLIDEIGLGEQRGQPVAGPPQHYGGKITRAWLIYEYLCQQPEGRYVPLGELAQVMAERFGTTKATDKSSYAASKRLVDLDIVAWGPTVKVIGHRCQSRTRTIQLLRQGEPCS